MSIESEEGRIKLIAEIEKKIDEKIAKPEASLVKAFLEQYYLGVSSYDLQAKSIIDLYGALISHWHFLYQRMPGESKLRVYNPQQEQNGWQSPHTVIELVHENKPFLLDSIRLALQKLDINLHLIIHAEGIKFKRDANGFIQEVLPLDCSEKKLKKDNGIVEEAPIYIEIDRQSDSLAINQITNAIQVVLDDVDYMVRDWAKMLQKMQDCIKTIKSMSAPNSETDISEIVLFLQWLCADHFTFIGYGEYVFNAKGDGGGVLKYETNTGLGILSETNVANSKRDVINMYKDSRQIYLNDDILLLGKTDTVSTVHRPAYNDFIKVKLFDAQGKPYKILRFIGLYTASVYNEAPDSIPFIRQKIASVFEMAKFPRASHDGKTLLHIIATLPRDELFYAPVRELFEFAIGILHLQERQKISLFMRRDTYGRYFSCLVFVPREVYNSKLRQDMQDIMLNTLHGESVTFDSRFSESIYVRIHFMVRVNPKEIINYNVKEIENKLIDVARSWSDDLASSLVEHCGEEKANALLKKYEHAFPQSYIELFSARAAVIDIDHIENLTKHDDTHLEMSLYRPIEEGENSFRFKIFRKQRAIPLSEIVPILERMGLQIISEQPHEIKIKDSLPIWINDYNMIYPGKSKLDTDLIKDKFQEAFSAVWHGIVDNDGFNRLVLRAELGWRDISVLRALYKYLWQVGLMFSQTAVEDALFNNQLITKQLMHYFYIKFDPRQVPDKHSEKLDILKKEIEAMLETVVSLNEDRILRSYLGALHAALRTNYFQLDQNGNTKPCCAFKFDSAKVPDLPLPKPLCEIFVYSPQVEGVHLRADRVARGGLRLSDRHEDYRTEVLSLMKTQQVKNAVIVPLGAKGGFIVKLDLAKITDRAAKMQAIIKCYQIFVGGLLDLTDNYQGTTILKPENTICWDVDDPYLVVAADKGTATFSDIANAISKSYNFWLGDAFASGGSSGYDHKKMAITAKGAWESVKMHFQRFNIDVQTQSVTVFGIGDMAGDVFGNGMLLSDKIKLIAAFNHMHIFFDPDPDPASSFIERKRLFELPGSAWSDYNPALISAGGGVFERSAKKINLSPQMQAVLKTNKESMLPNELIKAILTMQVDLFFNGGIGTFVKSQIERNTEVGDRANDAIRINGSELNVKVVCEGGNLGFTQLGRIEFALKGGIINTDAIDNSGGVNCSDNEVNIKILLNEVVAGGDMTEKQRNELLASMTSEVADLVLANNRKQNEALSLTEYQAAGNMKMHNRLRKDLERSAGLDSIVEFLPNDEELLARVEQQKGFTRPEIAVLMAYTKISLKKQLLSSFVPDDNYVAYYLTNYFPQALRTDKFKAYMQQHRLKRAIIATQLSNAVIDEMGINFIQRLEEESGAHSPEICMAYLASREVFDAAKLRAEIRNLGCEVDLEMQIYMLQELNRLIRRGTRWFLRNGHGKIEVAKVIDKFKPKVYELQENIDQFLRDTRLDKMQQERKRFIDAGIPEALAQTFSRFNALYSALDIVDAALQNNFRILDVAQVYFAVGGRLKLGWFGELINKQPVSNNWEALARAAFRDDVDMQQRYLATSILKSSKGKSSNLEAYTKQWFEQRKDYINRWEFFVTELKNSATDFTMFAVALRELLDLGQAIED